MSKRAGLAVLLAILVLVSAASTVGALGGDAPAQVGVETDSTTLNVGLQPDGNATWEIVYRIELDNENTTQAFESLAQDIETNTSTYLVPFSDRMARTVAAAENATGRQMAVRNISVDTRRESQPQVTYGVLVYRFEWTNFGVVDGGEITAGDAIDQFFLDSQSTLRFTGPDDYAVVSTTPEPTRTTDGEAFWEGQRDFDAGEPRVVFSQATPTETGGGGAGDGASGGSGGDGGTGGETDDSGGFPLVAMLALAALAVASAVWVVARRNGDGATLGDDEAPTASPGDSSGSERTAATTEDNSDGLPPELLSNEERVLQLLEQNGGRMKQKQLAEDLDWTAAKTSQVVGDLRDEEKVEAFRLGRENVLTLPDVELEPSNDDKS